MTAFAGIGSIVGVIIFIVCAIKESSTTGLYKFFGVYGRLKAYLFIDMVGAGIAMIVSAFIPGLDLEYSPIMMVLIGVVCLAIGILIYITTALKCPAGLKSRLLISMIISGLGIAMKIVVFFLFFVWKIYGPQEMVTSSGETVYRIGSDIYDASGNRLGHMNGADTFIIDP